MSISKYTWHDSTKGTIKEIRQNEFNYLKGRKERRDKKYVVVATYSFFFFPTFRRWGCMTI